MKRFNGTRHWPALTIRLGDVSVQDGGHAACPSSIVQCLKYLPGNPTIPDVPRYSARRGRPAFQRNSLRGQALACGARRPFRCATFALPFFWLCLISFDDGLRGDNGFPNLAGDCSVRRSFASAAISLTSTTRLLGGTSTGEVWLSATTAF